MLFRQLFDPDSSTYTYLLADEDNREAVIIDPVLDQIDRDVLLLEQLGLRLLYTLDTHVHADHVTAAGALRERLGCATVLGERAGVGCADVMVKDGDRIRFGRYELEARETPGHTNGCTTYVTGDRRMAFTGDALLIRGSGRTDFQQGDSRALYRSVREKIFALPDDTLVYPGHDYKGRTASSIGEERRHNPRLGDGTSVERFAEIMANLQLAYPKKIDVAVPANLRCGALRGMQQDAEPAAPARWAPIEPSASGVPELTVEWVTENPAAARLVDVREPDEFVGPLGHVQGAELVPLATIGKAAAAWDRTRPVVLICRSGGRSGKAALDLQKLGFRRVASVRGGMLRWNEAKLPIVAGASPAPAGACGGG